MTYIRGLMASHHSGSLAMHSSSTRLNSVLIVKEVVFQVASATGNINSGKKTVGKGGSEINQKKRKIYIMESGNHAWWCHDLEIIATLLALCEGNPLVTRVSNVELKWFLCSQTEQSAKQTVKFPVIWDWHSCCITVWLLYKDGWMRIWHWPDYSFNGWDSHQTNVFKDMYWIMVQVMAWHQSGDKPNTSANIDQVLWCHMASLSTMC